MAVSIFRATASLLIIGFASLVSAVDLNACSTQNFGASSVSKYDIYMSAGECKNYCSGSQFAIVQGKTCWCSNNLPPTWSPAYDCAVQCPGYPPENCATAGFYGYIAENANAQQAIINAVAAASSPSSSVQQVTSSVQAPAPVASTTVKVATSIAVIPTTNVVVSTSVAVITRVSNAVSNSPVTLDPQTVTQVVTSAFTSLMPIPPSSSPEATTSVMITPSVEVQTQRITVSGAVVTQVVYSTAAAAVPTRGSTTGESNNPVQASSNNGLSNGAVAGITVGAILGGLLIIGALVMFWRRRSRNDEESGMRRQPSLLSKAGLLGSARSRRRPNVPAINTNVGNFSGPGSAGTIGSGEMSQARRGNVDGRLNPVAIMRHENASRSSVGTFQDHQDYSRPLEIRNPD